MRLNDFKKFITALFFRLIVAVYERIFHEKMSADVVGFFKNIYYLGIGTIVATIFSFTFNILAGRIVGPSGYGKFALVQSIAMFLYIPMLFGIHSAMIKYNAESNEFHKQRSIISTAYLLVFALTFTFSIIFYLLTPNISEVMSTSSDIVHLSIIFSILFVFYTMESSTLQSLNKMKILSLLRPLFSITLLLSFIYCIISNNISFKSIVFSMYFAYGITGCIILIYVRKYVIFNFDAQSAKIIGRYGSFVLLSGLSFVLYTNIDKILINKYMLEADVGLYNAYYYGSINIVSMFLGILIPVLFPTMSKYKNKMPLYQKINKSLPYLIFLGLPIVLIFEFTVIKLYGVQYRVDIFLMILFAITSILVACYSIYAWLSNSEGENGVRLTLAGTGTIAISNVVLNIYLIPLFGLHGAIGSTALAYCIGMYVFYSRKDVVIKGIK